MEGNLWTGFLLRTSYVALMHNTNNTVQKLAAKDLDSWEQKRVKRLPGEHDGVL